MVRNRSILLDLHHICYCFFEVGIEFLDLLVSGKHKLVASLQFILYLPPLFLTFELVKTSLLLKVELV